MQVTQEALASLAFQRPHTVTEASSARRAACPPAAHQSSLPAARPACILSRCPERRRCSTQTLRCLGKEALSPPTVTAQRCGAPATEHPGGPGRPRAEETLPCAPGI